MPRMLLTLELWLRSLFRPTPVEQTFRNIDSLALAASERGNMRLASDLKKIRWDVVRLIGDSRYREISRKLHWRWRNTLRCEEIRTELKKWE